MSKSAITPSFSGRITMMCPGVLPIIALASRPTASSEWSASRIATIDGSLRTMPSPRMNTTVLAVPRSMPRSVDTARGSRFDSIRVPSSAPGYVPKVAAAPPTAAVTARSERGRSGPAERPLGGRRGPTTECPERGGQSRRPRLARDGGYVPGAANPAGAPPRRRTRPAGRRHHLRGVDGDGRATALPGPLAASVVEYADAGGSCGAPERALGRPEWPAVEFVQAGPVKGTR